MSAENSMSPGYSTRVQDHSVLARKLRSLLDDPSLAFRRRPARRADEPGRSFLSPAGIRPSRPDAYIVLREDCAVELGSPEKLSVSEVLWTTEPGIASDTLLISSPPLRSLCGGSFAFLQVLLLQLDSADRAASSEIERLKDLTNRLPGYMTRSVPGKTWARIHRELVEKGFELEDLAFGLYEVYRDRLPGFVSMDVVLVVGEESSISRIEPICSAAAAISGRNRKARWEGEGNIVCSDLDCSSCKEKPTCDVLREVAQTHHRDSKQRSWR